MKILITICARGGSKGIPGKNIKLLNGRPLLSYSISVAEQFKNKILYTDIVLSTDSEEIKRVAESFELNTEYVRPEHLAGDSVGKIDAINDVLLWKESTTGKKYDYILDLDVTSPLRNLEDLTKALEMIEKDKTALNLFSVSPAQRNPYFNMVEKKKNGYYGLIKESDTALLTRQSSPQVYDMNASFYVYRRMFFEQNNKTAITDNSLIYVTPHVCFDLDHPIDYEIMSYLISYDKLDFVL